jgi:hypothetical protein
MTYITWGNLNKVFTNPGEPPIIYFMPLILAFILLLTGCATSAPQREGALPPPQDRISPETRKQIRQAIVSHHKYMAYCYRQALTSQGGAHLKGKTVVHFVVGPDGKARNPKVVPEESSLQSPRLTECLFEGITSWDFPVHPKGEDMDIIFPFAFSERPPAGMQKKLDQFENLRSQ